MNWTLINETYHSADIQVSPIGWIFIFIVSAFVIWFVFWGFEKMNKIKETKREIK